MKNKVLFWVIITSAGFGCQKEKSAETMNNRAAACKSEYLGSCKLLQIVYEPISPTGVQQVVNLTYTGNQITLLEDSDDQRKIKYSTDGKVSSIEYFDKNSALFQYAIEKMSYNAVKQLIGILVLYNVGNNQFDSLFRTDLQYNTANQLMKKIYFEYDDVQKKWTKNEDYLYTYNNLGLVTVANYTNSMATPPVSFPIPVTYNDSCNAFQKVYPQLELLDYVGQEDVGGFSVLLTSRKLVSSFLNQNVTYTLNAKNAATEVKINGQLMVSYIYNCQ